MMKPKPGYSYSTAYNEQRDRVNGSPKKYSPSYNSKQDSLMDSFDPMNRSQYESVVYEKEELNLLRQALIDKHNKLLMELETKNRLEEEIRMKDKVSESLVGQNKTLLVQIKEMKAEWARLDQENRKNQDARRDLEEMRNKMLQAIMNNNKLDERNNDLALQVKKTEEELTQTLDILRERQEHIEYLNRQLENMRIKATEAQSQIHGLEDQVHTLNRLLMGKEESQNRLNVLLEDERQKNAKLAKEIESLESANEKNIKKMAQIQKVCHEHKQRAYWLEHDKEKISADGKQQIDKMAEEIASLTIMYQKKDRQLEILKNRPVQEAEKKRKNYENAKNLVHRLQSQQIQYEHTLRANQSRPTVSPSKSPIPVPKGSFSRSPTHSSRPATNPISHNSYTEDKGRYRSTVEGAEQIQKALQSCNAQKKKILAQIDRIQQTRVQTREIVGKRKRLGEELQYQEEKIRMLKEQLRKMRVF